MGEVTTCKYCGGGIRKVLTPGSSHFGKYECIECNKYNGFIPKPENEKKRRDKNHKWRDMWKEKGFVCGVCGATLKEFPFSRQWHIDHIIQLADGGADCFENTMPICIFCHTIKNAEQSRRKALRRELDEEWQRKNNA